ncbi:uncharacterized protein LOC117583225 [Drosophila guanche]|uniref:uncharacterized protein LOC117583225 n=1 Tax=Drosophila guanche TaxID=7266 RepID=UPI0014718FC7|nr:uncharacterized protein LOC117583225 [Drosophila guanche]
MRAFIVLCLVALASADKLGYNYQPVAHSPSGLSFQPSGLASNEAPAFPSGLASNEAPNFASAPSAPIDGPIGASTSGSPNYAAPQAELEKEFFTYTADEGDFYDPAASEQVSSSLNKALRVVFIKGPENRGLENAALALAKQAAQQETAIYVLNKQADIGDLANKLNSIRSNSNNKPEVHFVKYRTPEDAANAQKAIQGQYDQLGGSSQAHDGGVASSLNFASQPAPAHENIGGSASAPGASYLPANIFRRYRF